jgi:hypothetical protein
MVSKERSFVWRTLCALLCGAALSFSQKAVNVTTVRTGVELKAAIDAGAPHVHITEHLDLTALPFTEESAADPARDVLRPTALQSLTVCTVQPKL